MPKINIHKQTSLTANEAFSKVRSLLESDPDLKKLDSGYKTNFDPANLTGEAAGKMFKAHMTVKSSSSGSQVEIVVDLPLALTLIKGMIEKTLDKKLSNLV